MNILTGMSATWVYGLCAANRHQVCGPAESFPPTCDGCEREKFEADAARYRWLKLRGFGVIDPAEGGVEWTFGGNDPEVDQMIDEWMGSSPQRSGEPHG